MGFLQNMTFKSKLVALVFLMVVGMSVVAFQGFRASNYWIDDVSVLGNKEAPQIIATMRLEIERHVIREQTLSVYRFAGKPNAKEKLDEILKDRQKSWEVFEKNIKIYDSLTTTKSGKKDLENFTGSYNKWKDASFVLDESIKKLALNQNPALHASLMVEFETAVAQTVLVSEDMVNKLNGLLERREKFITQAVQEAAKEAEEFKLDIIVTSIFVLLISILLSFFIIRSVTSSITKAVSAISDGALQITSASDQVASSSTSLAQGASEQASSIEEVSATLEEAIANIASNTENARQADILAKSSNEAARDGLAKGEELVESMKEVTDSASKIANIVKTIDQIAFQVNLLALNAAVEAARAGEHGLGFAVVADEVRNLAQRAASSAKETGSVIEETVVQIKKGSEIANLASNSFREIEDKAKKVSDLIGEVALSSKEQSDGMNQLSLAVSQIDQVTQQVAANSEETAAASEELSAQAASSLEAVTALGKIIGLHIDTNQVSVGVKKQATPKIAASLPSKKIVTKESEKIFPLDEHDLREF